MEPVSNSEDINLIVVYEDPDKDEGHKEVQEAIRSIEEKLGIKVKLIPASNIKSSDLDRRTMVYLLALLKNDSTVKALEEISKSGANLIGKLPIEHVAIKAAEKAKNMGCKEVILIYEKRPGAVFREEQDDAWRLATLIEDYSGIPVTPSDTPELGGDCILVATLTRSRLTDDARTASSVYGKKIAAESVLELVKDDLPSLIKRALRASGILV